MANSNCKKCGGGGTHRSCLWYGRDGNGYKGWWDCQRSKSTDGYCRHSYVECSKCKGCFITSATLRTLKKEDDCLELNTFREFRDTFMKQNHPQVIQEYYRIAPSIVRSIEILENSQEIYSSIWENHLKPAYDLLNEEKKGQAMDAYIRMVKELEVSYL